VLCASGGGEDGGEAIAPKADDIAGERGKIAKQGVEAVHRQRFAPRFREGRLGRVSAFADGLALRRPESSACATGDGTEIKRKEDWDGARDYARCRAMPKDHPSLSVRCASRAAGSGSSNSIGARF
jgi:hypothetical protein